MHKFKSRKTDYDRAKGPKVSRIWDLSKLAGLYVLLVMTKCKDYRDYSRHNDKDLEMRRRGKRKVIIRVGCSKCSVCRDENIAKRASKWQTRLKSLFWQREESGKRSIFVTLTLRNYRDGTCPSFVHARHLAQKAMKRLQRRYNFKYWLTWEYGADKGRLHAHMFVMPTDFDWSMKIAAEWKSIWYDVSRAYIWHDRYVDSGQAAAWYATKYGGKSICCPRVMVSQKMHWDELNLAFRTFYYSTEGERKWVMVEEETVRVEERVKVSQHGLPVVSTVSAEALKYSVKSVVDFGETVVTPKWQYMDVIERGTKCQEEMLSPGGLSSPGSLKKETCVNLELMEYSIYPMTTLLSTRTAPTQLTLRDGAAEPSKWLRLIGSVQARRSKLLSKTYTSAPTRCTQSIVRAQSRLLRRICALSDSWMSDCVT